MKKIRYILTMLCFSFLVSACSGKSEESAADAVDSSTDETGSSIENCKKEYKNQVEKLKTDEKMSSYFGDCEFGDIEYIKTLNVLQFYDYQSNPVISVEESIRQFEIEIEKQGLTDKIDLKKELRDVSGLVEGDFSLDYPYFWPSAYENSDKIPSGSFFMIVTDDLHIQMFPSGFYSFSDTTIKKYVGSDRNSALDALGESFEHVIVEEGRVEDLKDKKWKLLNGEVSVGDAAEMTRQFFEAGTPYAPCEGVNIQIPYVWVIEAKDIYMYKFVVQRAYEGIPVAWKEGYSFNPLTDRMPVEDSRTAYTISGDKVNAYAGINASQAMKKTMDDQTEMINVVKASEILIDKLGLRLQPKIKKVRFEYAAIQPLYEATYETSTLEPCWVFEGVCGTDGKSFCAFENAITGEIYGYTQRQE